MPEPTDISSLVLQDQDRFVAEWNRRFPEQPIFAKAPDAGRLDDMDILDRFAIAAEGQNDDVIMWCGEPDCDFGHVEHGNAPASNLLIVGREHWAVHHGGRT